MTRRAVAPDGVAGTSPDVAARTRRPLRLTTRGTVPQPLPARTVSHRTRAALVLPAVALATVSLAACGGGSSSGAAASSAPATSAAAGATGGAGAGAAGFAAYSACLTKNGVTLPTGRPGGFARPSGSARPTARPSGAVGSRRAGGGFFGLSTSDPRTAAALKACASLRPTGGFGGGFGGANSSAIASQLTAYRSCLSDHGVTLPTPAARSTGTPAAGASGGPGRRGFGGIGALNTADPKTAAAVKACAALRPTFAPGAAGTPAPSATPAT